MQANKMTKESIAIFFINSDLVSIPNYLSNKNIDNIRILLTKLLYGKVV